MTGPRFFIAAAQEGLRLVPAEVHGPDPRRMITQERLPCLARSGSTLGHVLGDGRLSDLDPELQQFAMNTRRAPERVLHTQPADQAAHLNRNSGPAAARTRLPSPIKPKTRPMPAQHSVRLDDRDGAPQRRKKPPQPDKAAGQRPSAWTSRVPGGEARSADAVSNVTSASSCACVRKGAAKTWRNSLRKSSIARYRSSSRQPIQPGWDFR